MNQDTAENVKKILKTFAELKRVQTMFGGVSFLVHSANGFMTWHAIPIRDHPRSSATRAGAASHACCNSRVARYLSCDVVTDGLLSI
jgi:hypothetical protein